jgi:S-DNA-T family DNA segregation ATPase FtsK/SpoIIIE
MIANPPTDYPAESLLDLLAQASEIGLHVILARSTSQAMRSMHDPLLRRLWDLGTPSLLFSCPRDEGTFIGDAKPLTLAAGRAQLVVRREPIRHLQVGLLEGSDDNPKKRTR